MDRGWGRVEAGSMGTVGVEYGGGRQGMQLCIRHLWPKPMTM